LRKAHAWVRWHLEAAEFHQTQTTCGTVGRAELVVAVLGAVGVAGHVDQAVAQQAVSEPWRRRVACAWRSNLVQRDFQLLKAVVAGFVDARGL